MADNPNKNVRLQDIQEHVDGADVVSIQSPGYKDVVTLMKLYKSEGKKVVVDYDDYSFDLDPGNPRYAELGTEEKAGWKDGQNGFDLRANRAKKAAFEHALSQADMITTTTEYLAEKFRPHNANVKICPNSIDFDLWRPIPRPSELNKEVRIGWFGGDSHFVDLEIFKELFPRLADRFPQVKFVIQAPPVPGWGQFFENIPQERMEWYGWAELKWYTLFLASRHFDIGLCPLAPLEFNKCKSSIKAMEFQALGAAVVAQDMLPYSATIKEGKTGFLASTPDQWFEKISLLIENKHLREEMALNAYKDLQANGNLDLNCRTWESSYLDLMRSPCTSVLGPSFPQPPQRLA